MSERSSAEDPFADLFGRLPDPRTRESMTTRETATPAGDDRASTPPPSRRAAREAAAVDRAPDPVTVTDPPVPIRRAPAPVARSGGAAAVAHRDTQPPPKSRTATLEDLFTGDASAELIGSVPPPPDRRGRRLGGWIVAVLILVLLGGVAAGGFWVWNTYEDRIRAFMGWEEPKDYEAGIAEGDVTVTIASGDTGQAISNTLFEAGVTKTSSAFYDLLISTADTTAFYPGAYKLQTKMSAAAALAALQDPANKLQNTVQLREGLTVAQSLTIISESLAMPLEDLQAAVADPAAYGVTADSLEGWLFPATYTFDPGLTAADVVTTMVDRAVTSLDSANVPVEDRQRILTIASIIQREARFEADFYKVSRVIQNRLDPGNQESFGKLQMDSTAQYGYGEMHDGTVSTSQAALDDDNPWNTYVHTGLPVGPIANPGDAAIAAAMNPEEGPWLYFVTVNLDTGETVFTTNLADHNAAVAQFQSWCTEHPDSGC